MVDWGASGWRRRVVAILLGGILVGCGTARADTDFGALWQAYSAHFLSGDGRVVDPQGADRTTSEGQSYALFFALVNNEPIRFATILRWTQTNLAGGDLGAHLPGWSWGKAQDGHWGVLDGNSAADSDVWIAYDLIEAGRLWKQPQYVALGRRMLIEIAGREVVTQPDRGSMLLPAPTGFRAANGWITNPSYLPLFVLNRLAKVDPAGPWISIAINTPALVAGSSRAGFAFDWISFRTGVGYAPSAVNPLKGGVALGSYDAIRVYLWAGMLDDGVPAKARLLKALWGMEAYLQQHGSPPEKVNAAGQPEAQAGPVGFSAAVVPYLLGLGDEAGAQKQMARVQTEVVEKTALLGASPTYYDENLTLFSTGWLQRRFRFGANGEVLVPWVHP